ncbi:MULTISPECIES: sensor domain-containing protein [Thalassospira]|uniref:Diguanylate cyclase n=1 Tax=Thalassospira aquimaris TaxID=3037796 RepID=A0ABT6GA98_9PROT|nr:MULTISPECIES: diguanylate cyclase [Thalassospira]MDG4719006.1 diguanylate cyclase [Thalassospira sp. FZY0004]
MADIFAEMSIARMKQPGLTSSLRDAESRYKRLLDALAEGVVVHDASGAIVEFNDAALSILGLSREELIGATPIDPRWSCVKADGSPFPGEEHPAARVLVTHQRESDVVMGVNQPDGTFTWIRINAEPLFREDSNAFDGVIVSFADINAVKQAEVAVKERERLYRQMFKNTRSVNLLIDPVDGRIVDASNAAKAFYGFEGDGLIGFSILDLNINGAGDVKKHIADVLNGGAASFDVQHRLANGLVRDIQINAGLVELDERQFIHSTNFDVTDRKNYERQLVDVNCALSAERQRLDEIIWGTNVGTWEWHVQTGEVRFNERWADIIGYGLSELAPISIETWIGHCHPDDLEQSNARLQRVFSGEDDYYECECRMLHKSGHWVWVLDRGKVVEWDHEGNPVRMSGTHSDITPSKTVEAEIRRLAQTDQLTGLANRYQFNAMLSHIVQMNRRYNKNVVLMLLDLDYFKAVNDTFGHPVGDKLLVRVGEIIKTHSRDADVVARLGGDEFAIILPMIEDVADAATPAQRMIDEISLPHMIDGHEIRVGASIGISTCEGGESDPEAIYSDADRALYRAKACGRNKYCFHKSGSSENCDECAHILCGDKQP